MDTSSRYHPSGLTASNQLSKMSQNNRQTIRTLRPLSNRKNLISARCSLLASALLASLLIALCLAADSPQPISSRAAFLRAQRASRLQQQAQSSSSTTPPPPSSTSSRAPPSTSSTTSSTTSTTTTTTTTTTTSTTSKPRPASVATIIDQDGPSIRVFSSAQPANRTTRTADLEDFSIFVNTNCDMEGERMQVNIKTSKPFYGIIHTQNHRQKAACGVEGTGETEYNLDISFVLNKQDPEYCGMIRARRESPKDEDQLSNVIAVRFHKNIEQANDKFFLLNCKNRCRRLDCSKSPSAKLINPDNAEGEREGVTPPSRSRTTGGQETDPKKDDECTIYKFPWAITLLWCLGILLLAMIISHCIMCSSMVCRCVKTEVEEREPSVYEDETEDEDKLYNKKNHPMRIDYDNRDIYKTTNNYEPYNVDCRDQESSKSRQNSSKRSTRRYR